MSRLLDLIKRHEGFRKDAYWDKTAESLWTGIADLEGQTEQEYKPEAKDILGHLTIGYGFNLEAPRDEAFWEYVLEWDVRGAFIEASKYSWFGPLCGWSEDGHQYRDHVIEYDFSPLNPRQAVIVSMIHQLGPRGFAGFKHAIQFIKDEDWVMAADEMLDSKWAREDSPARAKELAEMMRSGEWPMSEAA